MIYVIKRLALNNLPSLPFYESRLGSETTVLLMELCTNEQACAKAFTYIKLRSKLGTTKIDFCTDLFSTHSILFGELLDSHWFINIDNENQLVMLGQLE